MRCRKRNHEAIDAGSFSWEVAPRKPEMKFLELEPYQSEGQKQDWKRAVRSQAAKAAHHTRRMKDPSFAKHRRTASRIQRKQSLPTPSMQPYSLHGSAPASVMNGDTRSDSHSPVRSPKRADSVAAGMSQPIFCLGPALTGMKPAAPPEPPVNVVRSQSIPSDNFSPYFAHANPYHESMYAPSSVYEDVSPRDPNPPGPVSSTNSSFTAYNPWPEIMLTPPQEEYSPYAVPSKECRIEDPADRDTLLAALQNPTFNTFAGTDAALQSAVDMAVKSITHSDTHHPTGVSESAKTVIDAESLAIVNVYEAMNDTTRATSDQLLAAVCVMALGAAVSGNAGTFARHTAGLLDMFAARGGRRAGPQMMDGPVEGQFARSNGIY